MKLQEILAELRSIAPEHLAESWDNVGLLVGEPGQDVSQALLCIDLTEAVLEEAITAGAQLIVSYHPPIFKPLTRLTDADWKQRIILRAARQGIAIYSPHTALDAAEGGVNDFLVEALDVAEAMPLRPHRAERLKMVVFVPEEALSPVRSAMGRAGAGTIGHYHECSFSTPGEGTFRGDDTSHPAKGEAERFERVAERRLEMELPRRSLPAVLAALDESHPYEEVAYDLYPLETVGSRQTGAGRAVLLREPMTADAVADRLKQHLGLDWLELSVPAEPRAVRWVGVCPGAGGSLLGERPVDLFFTGEMRHHDILDATAQGTAIALAGHTQTERPYLPVYRDRLAKAVGDGVTWQVSSADRAPGTMHARA